MTDDEHNLSTTKIHTHMDKIDDIKISKDDNIVTTNSNLEATRSSVKRRHYQRKRKEGAVGQISIEKNSKISTSPSLNISCKSEYDEKEVSFRFSFFKLKKIFFSIPCHRNIA